MAVKKVHLKKLTVAGRMLKMQKAHKRWYEKIPRLHEKTKPKIEPLFDELDSIVSNPFLPYGIKRRLMEPKVEKAAKILDDLASSLSEADLSTFEEISGHINQIKQHNPKLASELMRVEQKILDLRVKLHDPNLSSQEKERILISMQSLIKSESRLYRLYKDKTE